MSRTWREPWLNNATAHDFHGYVLDAVQVYTSCFARWSVRQCTYNHSLLHITKVRVALAWLGTPSSTSPRCASLGLGWGVQWTLPVPRGKSCLFVSLLNSGVTC